MAPMRAIWHFSARSFVSLVIAAALAACSPAQKTDARTPSPAPVPTPCSTEQRSLVQKVDASGCSSDHWCLVTGLPKQVTFSAVWGSAANDVWVAGEAGTLLHWNGAEWSSPSSGTE